jgi:hypothetical protein
MATLTIRIEGLDKMLRKAEGRHLLSLPLRGAFERSGYVVEVNAKQRAPVDRGQLRAGITHTVDSEQIPQFVEIGTRNIPYAPAVHDGRAPGSFPPVQAIAAWAARKSITADPYILARAIARRGIKGRPFLTDALAASQPRIQGHFVTAAKEIERQWQA